MWKSYKSGIENAIKSEEYDEQTSIELFYPGEYGNYEILCDCYNLIIHSVFADTIEDANLKYNQMKKELQEIADTKDEETREDMICDFVDRW